MHLIFFFSQFYEIVLDYQAVGLLGCRTIDTQPFKTMQLKYKKCMALGHYN